MFALIGKSLDTSVIPSTRVKKETKKENACRKEKKQKFRVADTSHTAFIGKTFGLHTVELMTAVQILFRI